MLFIVGPDSTTLSNPYAEFPRIKGAVANDAAVRTKSLRIIKLWIMGYALPAEALSQCEGGSWCVGAGVITAHCSLLTAHCSSLHLIAPLLLRIATARIDCHFRIWYQRS